MYRGNKWFAFMKLININRMWCECVGAATKLAVRSEGTYGALNKLMWIRLATVSVGIFLACVGAVAQSTCGNQAPLAGQPATTPAWMNPASPTWTVGFPYTPANRAATLLNAMTLAQMEQQMAGQGGAIPEVPGCGTNPSRHLLGIPALCIQTYRITNGPPGIGASDCATQPKATALPSDLTLTMSFDPSLAHTYGTVVGAEARSLDLQVIEGPGMDMLRVPQGGRSFEYAGEDPFLAGAMVAQIVQGTQSSDIIGLCKHFQGNDQEVDRTTVSDIISEQARNEIYFTPFRMCVKDGGAFSVMCAYNLVGGVHACQDPTSLTDALRTQWGFPGYVQSDFGATQSTSPSILAGHNMEMNSPVYFSPAQLTAALNAGPSPATPLPGWLPNSYTPTGTLPCGLLAGQNANCITPLQLYGALLPRYTVMFQQGIFDRPVGGTAGAYDPSLTYPTGTPTTTGPQIDLADATSHGNTARSIADQSAVLLKNVNNILPLHCTGAAQTIALIGPSSLANTAYIGGGGSSQVSPIYSVTALAGLQAACPTATITVYSITSAATATAAYAGAAVASLAIVIVGDEESEGSDRATVAMVALNGGPLPDAIVEGVIAAQPNTVVVLVNGDPVTLPWVSSVPAILEVGYPGEEYGNVIADLLYGVCTTWTSTSPTITHSCINPNPVNPSGKLTMTFPVLASDVNASTTEEYPGIAETLSVVPPPSTLLVQAFNPVSENGAVPNPGTYGGPAADLWVSYNEGMEIGYRWYEAQNITPQYCFGFGLSYTTFAISNVAVTPSTDGTQPVTVTATVKNTGTQYGAEVVQVYLGFPQNLGEPPRRLVGFQKIWLNPGQSGPVAITIDPAATNYPLSYWNSTTHKWAVQPGTYTVYVGNSSGSVGASPGCTGFAYTGQIAVGSGTSESATNDVGLVSVTASGFVYNRLRGTGSETVTITNTSAAAISGPIQLVLSIVGSGVTPVNNSGNSNALGGDPYWTAQSGSLAPGASVTITVTLSYGIGNFTTPSPSVYSGAMN